MAQSGYQQLAGQVMKNGGTMQDAGRYWKKAGKNLQKALQLAKQNRHMKGGAEAPDLISGDVTNATFDASNIALLIATIKRFFIFLFFSLYFFSDFTLALFMVWPN